MPLGTGTTLLHAGCSAGRRAGAGTVRRAGQDACTCTRGGREEPRTAIAAGCKGYWHSWARVVLGILIGTLAI
jgi:hypothetical protein